MRDTNVARWQHVYLEMHDLALQREVSEIPKTMIATKESEHHMRNCQGARLIMNGEDMLCRPRDQAEFWPKGKIIAGDRGEVSRKDKAV